MRSNEFLESMFRNRRNFSPLAFVLSRFVSDNKLPEPATVVSTLTRGLFVYWENGDEVSIYRLGIERSCFGCNILRYGLQGRIDDAEVNLMGGFRISRLGTEREAVRLDEDANYLFLGVQAKAERNFKYEGFVV